jgi:aryl-alcohol dehydrogenase-like predicted oxidoreductase
LLDTADMYGPFTNERLVGRAIAGHRDEVVVATKFGNQHRPDGSWVGINGEPDHVRRACDGSLARLGIDHIDLYYQHRVDRLVPVEDTWGDGRAGRGGQGRPPGDLRGGAGHDSPGQRGPSGDRRAERVLAVPPRPEGELLATVRELGIGLVGFAPLSRGLLSGRLTSPDDFAPEDLRRDFPRFRGENLARNLAVVEQLQRLADEQGVTASQLAIAWLLAQGEDLVAIPGAERRRYLEENLRAVEVRLTPRDLAAVEQLAWRGVAAGER